MNSFIMRIATEKDIDLIFQFTKDLAEYEKMLDVFYTTKETLYDSIFIKKVAEVLIGEEDGKPVGQCIFLHNFSTFTGKAGLYLEDIYIDPKYRGKGYGKEFFKKLAEIAIERDYPRFEWICLDWNQPSIDFYEAMGASVQNEWRILRMETEEMKALIAKK